MEWCTGAPEFIAILTVRLGLAQIFALLLARLAISVPKVARFILLKLPSIWLL